MAEKSPYLWETVVTGDIINGLYISVDSLMDLRNKMGQFQEESMAPDACLYLLDYIIQAAQYTATMKRRRGQTP